MGGAHQPHSPGWSSPCIRPVCVSARPQPRSAPCCRVKGLVTGDMRLGQALHTVGLNPTPFRFTKRGVVRQEWSRVGGHSLKWEGDTRELWRLATGRG